MSVSTFSPPWRRETIPPASWYERLPEPFLDALSGLLSAPPDPLTTARLPEAARRIGQAFVSSLKEALEHGPGFVVLEKPGRDYDDRQRTLLYWLVGQALGRPVVQNVQGVLLYDVRDTGQDVRQGARFSITSAESSFHTDASFFDEVVDTVGLLCLRPARAGGVSQVVNGRSVYEALSLRRPDVLEVLSQPFHVDRRGGLRPGETPTALFAVLSRKGPELLFRYLRFWIEAGHDRAGEPLSPTQREALDALDGVLGDPSLRAEFVLRPGEMFFINNRWILHNRTAFEDFAEVERRRWLVRLWLAKGDA